MVYRKNILSEDPVQTEFNTGSPKLKVVLEAGLKYKIVHDKPSNKKDKDNNGRIVEILGFTQEFMGMDVIVRYLDNNRRGRVHVNCLLPYVDAE